MTLLSPNQQRQSTLSLATTKNVIWIRNCSTYNQPMISHMLGMLAASRCYCICSSEWQATSRCQGLHLESMMSHQKWLQSMHICLKNIPAKSDLKWQSLRLFWTGGPKKKNNNKKSSGIRSVPDPKKQPDYTILMSVHVYRNSTKTYQT